MRDILGIEIQEGQFVFILEAHGSTVYLELAIVIGFTNNFVKISRFDWSGNTQKNRASHNLMVIDADKARQWIENRYGDYEVLLRETHDRIEHILELIDNYEQQ